MVSWAVGIVTGHYLCYSVFCLNCIVAVLGCWCGCRTLHMFCCILQELYGTVWFVSLVNGAVTGHYICSDVFCWNCMVDVLYVGAVAGHYLCSTAFCWNCMVWVLCYWCGCLTFVLLYFARRVWLVSLVVGVLSDITYVPLHFAGTVWFVFCVIGVVVCVLHYLCSVIFFRNCIVGVLGCRCGCQTLPMFCIFCKNCMAGVLGCWCGCRTLPMFCVFCRNCMAGVLGCWCCRHCSLVFCRNCMVGSCVVGAIVTHKLCSFVWLVPCVVVVARHYIFSTLFCRNCMVGVLGCWCGCRTLPMFCCILQDLYGWCPVLLVRLSDVSFLLYFAETVWLVSWVVGAVARHTHVLFCRNCMVGVLCC